MAHAGTLTNLRYLNRSNNKASAEIMENYYRELITSHGVDAVYYRHDAKFFDTPSSLFVNNIYGEKSTRAFTVTADVVTYLEISNDNIVVNAFGAETDCDGVCYFVKDDFSKSLRDVLGTPMEDDFSVTVSGNFTNYVGSLSGTVINEHINGYVLNSFDDITDFTINGNQISVEFDSEFIDIPEAKTQYIYKSATYDPRVTYGSLTGTASGTMLDDGTFTLVGNASGTLDYFIEETGEEHGKNWNIAPQVGDFIRLSFDENNREEYEITRVYDRKLKYTQSINQLLYRYIWKCDIVRRDPSYENVIGENNGNTKEENWT